MPPDASFTDPFTHRRITQITDGTTHAQLPYFTTFALTAYGSSWTSQDVHPHPVFNHRDDAVYFTSDRSGLRQIYQVWPS